MTIQLQVLGDGPLSLGLSMPSEGVESVLVSNLHCVIIITYRDNLT